METINLGAGNGAAASLVTDTTDQDFVRDVIDESRNQPVLVDFWAPWCGPCRTLGPTIEKVVNDAGGAVKLAKINIDENPAVAGQLGIQSIPAVIAFAGGKPVDGFMGAVPEGQVRAFVEKVGGPVGPSEADQMVAAGDAALLSGDTMAAGQQFAAALATDPANLPALLGVARVALAMDDADAAREALDRVPEEMADDPAVAAVRAQLNLVEQSAAVGDGAALEERLAANPRDYEAGFELALLKNSAGDRESAVDLLLDIVRADRSWEDDKARKQLLEFFEAWGPKDEATLSGRRRLSSLLFA